MNTTIASITALDSGAMEIQLRKRPIDPYDEAEAVRGFHRRVIDAGDSVEILEDLNASLAEMGVAPVADDDWQRVRDIAAAAVRSGT